MNAKSPTTMFLRSPIVRKASHGRQNFRKRNGKFAVKVGRVSSNKIVKGTNRGRWERHERLAFLKGFRIYGKGKWKQIGRMIPSRTTIQVKTHAQMVLKRIEMGEDVFAELDLRVDNNIQYINKSKSKIQNITDDTSTTDESTDDSSCSDVEQGGKLICPDSLEKLTKDPSTSQDQEAEDAAYILTTLRFARCSPS